jgi:hypothetical protein
MSLTAVLLETTYLNTLTLSLLGASIRALIGWTILDWTMLGGASARHALWVLAKLVHVEGGIRNWVGVLKEVAWECWKGIEIVGSTLGVS